MEEIMNYLRLKNQYLEKFYSTSKKFLESTEDEKWNDIEFFVDNRERILNIIRYFDYKVASLFQDIGESNDDLSEYQEQVKALFDAREGIAKRIVDLDLELISTIDDMKTETITELKRTITQKQQLDSFNASAAAPMVKFRKPTKSA